MGARFGSTGLYYRNRKLPMLEIKPAFSFPVWVWAPGWYEETLKGMLLPLLGITSATNYAQRIESPRGAQHGPQH